MYKIAIRVDGQTVVLSSEDSVRMAIQRGDLRRDTRVIVETHDREDFVGIAESYRWLRHRLDEVDPPAENTVPTVVEETTEAPPAPPPEATKPSVPEAPKPADRPKTEAARPDHSKSNNPPLPSPPSQPTERPSSKAGLWWILASIAVIGGITWLANQPTNDAYLPTATEEYVAAPIEELAPVYPALSTSQMYAFPQYLTGSEIYQIGDLVVELGNSLNGGEYVPVVYVTDLDGSKYMMSTVGSYSDVEFGVGDLDGDGLANDLVLTGFSNGSHCCVDVQVATRVNGTWKAVNFGTWGGAALESFPTDMGGDRAPEFRVYDRAFLYAFDEYAANYSPVNVLKLRNGAMVNVSEDRAYRQVHVNRMAELEPQCREGRNGVCAAYVASAARAQNMSPAWAVMLDSARNTDWVLPSACLMRTQEVCPPSMEVEFGNYPEALQYFLGEHGFSSKVYVRAEKWDGSASFDCGDSGLNPVLTAVCANSYLRLKDHEMAVGYTQALAFSRDRVGLQRRQQQWIEERNALPIDPKIIADSYQRRAQQLASGHGAMS